MPREKGGVSGARRKTHKRRRRESSSVKTDSQEISITIYYRHNNTRHPHTPRQRVMRRGIHVLTHEKTNHRETKTRSLAARTPLCRSRTQPRLARPGGVLAARGVHGHFRAVAERPSPAEQMRALRMAAQM